MLEHVEQEVKDLWHIWSIYLSALLSHGICSLSGADREQTGPLTGADWEWIGSGSRADRSAPKRDPLIGLDRSHDFDMRGPGVRSAPI